MYFLLVFVCRIIDSADLLSNISEEVVTEMATKNVVVHNPTSLRNPSKYLRVAYISRN